MPAGPDREFLERRSVAAWRGERLVALVTQIALILVLAAAGYAAAAQPSGLVLKPETFRHYIDQFNRDDEELYPQHIPNTKAWEFLSENIPLFECPDKDIERTYYFRWWTYRKHIEQTPDGFVITEFLPKVPWAGKYNTISCAAGHHFYEGRWLHDPKYLNDYALFWFRKGGAPRSYSFWAADALRARSLVTGDWSLATDLLPALIRNYEEWEKGHRGRDGLFWQSDDADGMELSIGGSGRRPTINSYMYGEAMAIAEIATQAGRRDLASRFQEKAARLKRLVETRLWDSAARFFKTLPRGRRNLVDVRELQGYTPWYFDLPRNGFEGAWMQIKDSEGFYAPYGPTTAEQRHPRFAVSYQGHECQWNGPSWPYATSVTLTALANLLNDYEQGVVTRADYFDLLKVYTDSQRLTREGGRIVPWIDEDLDPRNGVWLARARLKNWRDGTWDAGKGGKERGKDYNHSTYCDLIISGLVGLRPQAKDVLLNPLLPSDSWDWFCLDKILYHGRIVTVIWDRTGEKYGKGKGLRIFADGRLIASRETLGPLTSTLPPSGTSAGWEKFEDNPVLGGSLGTCFDTAMLFEDDTYRMWFSWRPEDSIALTESRDGIHWSRPRIALGPNPATGWEVRVNRPSVVKRDGIYHMWYTGQTEERSWIGHATSPDGREWKRASIKPVLSADQPWEKVAVMCPHVLWDNARRLYRMWYSGGQQHEPNAIGYATSADGVHWTKHKGNPVFSAAPADAWERHKVTACQVIPAGDWYIMFYIGFRDEDHAQIGVARSRDGVSGWQRHPANPIIFPTEGAWDADACYKPFAIYDGEDNRWLLWYNGRSGDVEQIGLATHHGFDLGFPPQHGAVPRGQR